MKSQLPAIVKDLVAGREPGNGGPGEDYSLEEARCESEDRYKQIFDNVNAVIVRINKTGKITEISSRVEEFYGYKREDVLGKHFTKVGILTMKDLPKILKLFGDAMLGRQLTYKGELETRDHDGNKIYIDINSTVIKKDGKIDGAVAIIHNVTERKRVEELLQKTNAEMESFINNIPDMAWLKDVNFNFIMANRVFYDVLGMEPEYLKNHTPEVSFGVKTAGKFEEDDRKVMASRKQLIFEESILDAKKNRIWLETIKSPIIDASGNVTGTVGVSRNITERKQMEERLRKSEQYFRAIFENAGDAIYIMDFEGRHIVNCNRQATIDLGYSREEILQLSISDIEDIYTPEEIIATHQRLKLGESPIIQSRHRRKDGSTFPVEIRFSLPDPAQPDFVIISVRDITMRRQAEEKLRQSEEFSSSLLENAPNPVEVVNHDMTTRYVNKAFEELTGFTSAEVVDGKPPYPWWPEELKRELGEAIGEDLVVVDKTGTTEVKIIRKESVIQNKKGERLWVELSIVPVKHGGTIAYLLVNWVDITARKRMEQALRDSEEKFSKAFLASPDAIAISTIEDGRIIEVNESFVKMFGYSRAEAIGHTSYELNLWSPAEERKKMLAIIKERGSIHNELFRFRAKSGEMKIGLFSAELITLGNKPYMLSANVDVTRQKVAEERLRLLGSVTQQVTDSIIITDLDHKITYMNKAAEDLYGYSINEMMGIIVGTLNVIDSSKVRQAILDELAQGNTWSGMMVKRRKDGSTFLCDCRQSPLYDENGRISSYIIVHRDITEQKEIEAKLKAQKQLIESILTSMPEGVLVTDSSDRIVLVNEAFRRIFQTGKRVIENRLLNETLRVGQLAKLYQAMKQDGMENNSLEFRYKVKDQEKVITCVIIKMEGGRMLLTFIDVSREREEEDKLYLMDRLASLGEMAVGLAHELNNPLTGILTLSQLLVNTDMPEQQKEDLQCVYDEAKRAANIVKNVLLFTRNNTYENGQSSVNEVVKEVLRLREHEARTSNINVVTDLQDNLPEIPLDKYQLQQVFLNIILNAEAAIKETGRPGVLTVATGRANHHVNIMFSDTGCGIKKDVLPRIFDPFFTTKEIGKGTGLGLSICYGIIVKHNGKISVKTRVGKGTTFTIRLPVVD